MQNDLEYRLFKEEQSLAPISKRAFAFFVDKLLLSFIVFAAMGDKLPQNASFMQIVEFFNNTLLFTTVVEIAYQGIFTKLYGATLGKMLVKIRVVDIQMLDTPSWAASFLRASVRFFSEALFYLGFVWAIFDPVKQGWHDKFAKTLVLNNAI
ncbi:MAG: RDD family protein [Campylobacterales bacterium]|nr:RDD family protein [Campylobacterales bacterium]